MYKINNSTILFKTTIIKERIAMPSVKYLIELSDDDRRKLMDIVRKGSAPAKTILRANILLASDRNGKHPMTNIKSLSVMMQHAGYRRVTRVRTQRIATFISAKSPLWNASPVFSNKPIKTTL